MKLQILVLFLLASPGLPAQKKASRPAADRGRACRTLLTRLIEGKKVDEPIAILAQAQGQELAPLATWNQRAKQLLLAFPEEMEAGNAAGLDRKLGAALKAKTAEEPEAQVYIASGQAAFDHLQAFRKRLAQARRELILAAIGRARDGQSVYEGQFAVFAPWGKDGLKLVLAMLDPKSRLYAGGNEDWLLRLVRDLRVRPKKRQLARLEALADDLMLDDSIRYLAMLCLADFGKTERFEAKEAEYRKLSSAAQEWNQRDGWQRLGRLYSDARKPKKAIEAFEKGLVLRKAESDASLAGLRYNLCCALAKVGRLDEAFAAFDKVLAGGKGLSDRLLMTDRDLDPLRKDPRWDKLMAKYKRLDHAKPLSRPAKKKEKEEGDGGH